MGTSFIYLHPNAGVAPSDNPALWKRADDTNQDKPVIEYADGVTENYDWSLTIPGDYVSGGTLRLYWRANSATTNSVRWSVQAISRADNESSDAAFNAADAANFANASATANIVNIDTLVLTNGITGWAVSEELFVRISRIGADAGDTMAAAAQLLNAVLEYQNA